MNKEIHKIKEFWDGRAETFQMKPQATTMDIWLRQIEINQLESEIKNNFYNEKILDIGCGNGYSTIELARRCKDSYFVGVDYSEKMITLANKKWDTLAKEVRDRVEFFVDDILCFENSYRDIDIVITDRCLINLPSLEFQKQAIENIGNLLQPGKTCFLIENFIEGHNNFNRLRKYVGLNEIPVRWFNFFFNEKSFRETVSDNFEVTEIRNISSLYYLITRVIYSKICQLEGKEPDYDNIIHKVSTELPAEGDYGPVKLAILKKIK